MFFGFNDPGGTAWSSAAGTKPYTLFGGFLGESRNSPLTSGNYPRNTGAYGLSSSGFQLRFQPDAAGETGRVTMAMVFEASQGGLSFDSDSFMRIGGGTVWQTDANLARFDNLGSARWLVRSGATYYVSETQIANNDDGRLLTGAEIASTNWAVYNPTDAFSFDLNLTFNVAASVLTDLNAFGLITYKDVLDQQRTWLQFTQFEVVAVPEPSTYAAILGALALAGVAWRRRRR